tara:strand:- start:5297 stop:6361 length:1065 start_codon:yes stop_codon:yes gene_type:complete
MRKLNTDALELDLAIDNAKYSSEPHEEEPGKTVSVDKSHDPVLKQKSDENEQNSPSRAKAGGVEPEERIAESFMMVPPSGRKAKVERVRIHPKNCEYWDGNPRNFGKKDVSDLVPLVKNTNGNIVAVLGRYKKDADGIVELIWGTRRHEACAEANKYLLVDIVDVTDDEADALSFMENAGRKDITALAICRYFKHRFKTLKEEDETLTVGQFAAKYDKDRAQMNKQLSYGGLPDELEEKVENQESWTYRRLEQFNKAVNSLGYSIVETAIKKMGEAYKDAEQFMRDFKKITEKLGGTVDEKPKPKTYRLGEGRAVVDNKVNGGLHLKLDSSVAEAVKDELQALLKKIEAGERVG